MCRVEVPPHMSKLGLAQKARVDYGRLMTNTLTDAEYRRVLDVIKRDLG